MRVRIVRAVHVRPFLAAFVLSILLPAGARAVEFGPDDAETDAPLTSHAGKAQHLINQAMSYLGIRYRFGGTSPESGLDCSGLVQNVFRNAAGLDLPRTTREMSSLGNHVARGELKPGDLVFFNTMRRTFSHVGIYLGDNQFVHAPAKGGSVRVDNIRNRYWTQRFNGARRLISDNAPSAQNPAPR